MCEATVMSPNPGDLEKRPLSGIVDPGDEKASPQEDPHHEKGEQARSSAAPHRSGGRNERCLGQEEGTRWRGIFP